MPCVLLLLFFANKTKIVQSQDAQLSVDDHMDGHGEQPRPAPGGGAGRSEILQGGVQGAPEREDGGPTVPDRRARLHNQRTSFAAEVTSVARS